MSQFYTFCSFEVIYLYKFIKYIYHVFGKMKSQIKTGKNLFLDSGGEEG